MEPKAHWEGVYARKQPTEVSWYQPVPATSLALIEAAGATAESAIIDVGGGDSRLVDALLERGLGRVTVLDISAAALARARARLGERAAEVAWLEADITRAELPAQAYDIWHDRALFHFLTSPSDRRAYADLARHAMKPGGTLILGGFAPDGPTRCSGLDVARWEPRDLARELGEGFRLLDSLEETHHTPARAEQRFSWAVLRRS